jgi:uncharacterized membrane protein
MFKYISLYVITFVIFLIIDLIWLNFIAKDFYQKEIGSLLLKNPNLIPAFIFYLLFVAALLILVVVPGIEAKSIGKTLALASVFGLITYATYDLTNLATLKNWSLKITLIDLAWGVFVSSSTAYLSYFVGSKIL